MRRRRRKRRGGAAWAIQRLVRPHGDLTSLCLDSCLDSLDSWIERRLIPEVCVASFSTVSGTLHVCA